MVHQGPFGDGHELATMLPPGTLNRSVGRLMIQEGDDLELDSKDSLPYDVMSVLGHGGSAYVEKVRDVHTGSVFARKTYRNVYARTLRDAKNRFRNELRILHRLQHHHHIIQLYATYVAQRELAIILHPVADSGDLTAYLNDYTENYHERDLSDIGRRNRRAILWKAFGCLASTLVFIHEQAVRHKDIKPQNVLIHEGNILFTDFGISFDFQDEGSTTTGNPRSITRRYCAPEVAYWGKRNRKSDIFSLGCVFIEILAALEPDVLPEGLLIGPFFETFSQIPSADAELPRFLEVSYGYMLSIVHDMMNPDSQRRPSASEIIDTLTKSRMAADCFCDSCLPTCTPHRFSTRVPARRTRWILDRTRAMWSLFFIVTIYLVFFRLIGIGSFLLRDPTEKNIKSPDPGPEQASVSTLLMGKNYVIASSLLGPSQVLSASTQSKEPFVDTSKHSDGQKWYFSETNMADHFRIHSVLTGDFTQ